MQHHYGPGIYVVNVINGYDSSRPRSDRSCRARLWALMPAPKLTSVTILTIGDCQVQSGPS
jgi:hypothetical protein